MKLMICTQVVDKNDPILGFFHGWLLAFAQHFSAIYVICLKEGAHSLPPHVHVFSLGKEHGENKLKYLVRFYFFFSKIFFSTRVDFVFFHMGAIFNILSAPFFFVRTFFHTKFYWWKAHGHINVIGHLARMFVDRVYTSTESGFRVVTKKRHIVGQAIDTHHFIPKTSIPFEWNTRAVIFVGRITPIKRLEDFILTAHILSQTDSLFTFVIVGPIEDEQYYKKLEALCVAYNLPNVVFLGPKTQEEIVSFYHRANIFLNTSRTQSMDKTLLESVLCGCIPVTGNLAFETLLDKHKLYLPHATPQEYAMRILELVTTDTALVQHALREEVIRMHSLETFSKRIFNV